jgi:DNA primase
MLEEMLRITTKALSKEAISYLKSRGISKESAVKWKMGYLSSDALLANLEEKELLYEKGILLRKINKSPLNQYITFPLFNQYNELIGFSGRPPISNEEVKQRGLKKYWHSRLDKKRFLFGLNHAIAKARELNYLIVGEGQFDTIIAHQSGIENMVSTCGTALTEDQVIIISRYVDRVYIVFDNDTAGQEAFEQLEKYKKYNLELIPVTLPDSVDSSGNVQKEDPDSFIRKYGGERFLECVLSTKEGYSST